MWLECETLGVSVFALSFLSEGVFWLKVQVFATTTSEMSLNGLTWPFFTATRITLIASFTTNDITERPNVQQVNGEMPKFSSAALGIIINEVLRQFRR